MGLVIKISFCYDWERVYFVQDLNETVAKEKAFKMFKQYMSCCLPDTLEEAEKDDSFLIEIVETIEQIIL
jgi:hypothetical protein